ncbi:hypothetical protein HanXRQr2_Chr02g0054841 [Helianthus annuus]|uniref:Uncharacterized protein n=1 Tax=Helianthus annuus TaxID=4232 RepID=A0A9K3JMD2_HELAN|nr:hypothetical protein HanXRQr2_Chr02g0054841 [Helianthus annuus]KAJ0776516.1 hypothetical protein HanLR1_Chr02g0046531 [Helianthus annuus]
MKIVRSIGGSSPPTLLSLVEDIWRIRAAVVVVLMTDMRFYRWWWWYLWWWYGGSVCDSGVVVAEVWCGGCYKQGIDGERGVLQ